MASTGASIERPAVSRLTAMSGRERCRTSCAWLWRGLRSVTRRLQNRPDRFLLLKPALFAHQALYDRVGRTRHTLLIRDAVDFQVIEQIFVLLDYDFAKLQRASDVAAFHERLRAAGRTPLIVDAGANIGMATKYFSMTYPGARVVAIEPDAGNLALARTNNPEPTVQFLHAGVGSTDTRGRLVDPGWGHWGYRLEPDPEGPIDVVSISGIVDRAEREGVTPFIAKIDIEGSEAELFSRHTEWIDRFPVVIIELHDWMLPGSGNARAFLQEVGARDRDFVYSGENVFSLSNTLLQT